MPPEIGTERSVAAIDNLSVKAVWKGRHKPIQENSATYSSPPGWVIVDHQTHIISSSNGWRSVSVVNQGTEFASKEDVRSAYQEAESLAVKYMDMSAATKLKGEEAMALSRHAEVVNPGNSVVRAVVKAQPKGLPFVDTRSGWEEINVRVTERYIGTRQQILDDLICKHNLKR